MIVAVKWPRRFISSPIEFLTEHVPEIYFLIVLIWCHISTTLDMRFTSFCGIYSSGGSTRKLLLCLMEFHKALVCVCVKFHFNNTLKWSGRKVFLAIIVCICVLNIKREFTNLIRTRPAKHNDSDKSKNYSIIASLNKGSLQ